MASSVYGANDLRHPGTEVKRFHDQKAKWAYGSRCSRYGATPPRPRQPHGELRERDHDSRRPAFPDTHYMKMIRVLKHGREHNLNFLARDAKITLRQDVREVLDDDTSADETKDSAGTKITVENSIPDEGGVPLPYDASGQTILGDAVDKAVEKFETKETEKLVREYEVVPHGDNEMATGCLVDDDGFELVEYV